jgi:hypothetical protein
MNITESAPVLKRGENLPGGGKNDSDVIRLRAGLPVDNHSR